MVCVRICMLSARVPCVVSADVTVGTVLSRGVGKSWDRSSGERERERDRNRQEERKSEESNKTDITPALQRNTEAKKALLCG